MYFVLHKSLSQEQRSIRMRFLTIVLRLQLQVEDGIRWQVSAMFIKGIKALCAHTTQKNN